MTKGCFCSYSQAQAALLRPQLKRQRGAALASDYMDMGENTVMNQSEQMESLLIIDSFALLFRGYYATALQGNLMQNSKGLYTNGIYQFTRYMLDAIKRFKPTHVACAFDMGKSTFRNEMYTGYKANRDEPPLELIPQFD